MSIIDVYLSRSGKKLGRKFDELIEKFRAWESVMSRFTDEIESLRAEIQNLTTAVASAVALMGSIATLIEQNAADETALQEIATELRAKSQELADAVVANTPSE